MVSLLLAGIKREIGLILPVERVWLQVIYQVDVQAAQTGHQTFAVRMWQALMQPGILLQKIVFRASSLGQFGMEIIYNSAAHILQDTEPFGSGGAK